MLFQMVQKFFHFSAKNIFLVQERKTADARKKAIFKVASLKKLFPYTTSSMCAKFQSCFTKCTIVMFLTLSNLTTIDVYMNVYIPNLGELHSVLGTLC